MPKPLLIRLAQPFLAFIAFASLAFLFMAAGDPGLELMGAPLSPWSGRSIAVLAILLAHSAIATALLVGFWRGRRWSRPLMVWSGPLSFLLFLIVAPTIVVPEIVVPLVQVLMASFIFYLYLYHKPNVRAYYEAL